jgi:hypothetical protein
MSTLHLSQPFQSSFDTSETLLLAPHNFERVEPGLSLCITRWPATSELLPLAKKRRGPVRGTVARYAAADRNLFHEISSLVNKGLSLTGAIKSLENERKLEGWGTAESRIRRVMRLYQKERLGRSLKN